MEIGFFLAAILYPIFDFFAVFWFFWITLSVARISPPNSFGKVLFCVRVHIGTPLTTNGSTLYLDHLSVNYALRIAFILARVYSVVLSVVSAKRRLRIRPQVAKWPGLFFPLKRRANV